MAAGLLSLAVLTALVQTASPQIPDLSGRWVIVPEASIWHDRGHPVNIRIFGEAFLVRQDQRTVTIAIAEERGFEWRYNLDGTESHHVLPLPNGDEHTTSKLWFDGRKIGITTGSLTGGAKRATLRTIELIADDTVRVEAPFGRDGEMIGSVYRRVRED
jgi:hypothetical protein